MAPTLATLYLPNQSPQLLSSEGLIVPNEEKLSLPSVAQVSTILECSPNLVDILASGPGYVFYSIFDSKDKINLAAMAALTETTGVDFDLSDDDSVLRGAILLIVNSNQLA